MKLKYELNDLVVIKAKTKSPITIRIFEVITYPFIKIRGIDDITNVIYILQNLNPGAGKHIWVETKHKYLKTQTALNFEFNEIDFIKNTFLIDTHKKSFFNLKSGFDINILKFEEIKLFSLNLHVPLGSPNLTSEKIIFLINKFIWDLEKTIPADVYYQSSGIGVINNKNYSFVKVAVFLPNYLIRKETANINYHTLPTKITVLNLIRDVWSNALSVHGVRAPRKEDYISEYNYYATTITHSHPIDNLAKIISNITFDFTNKKSIAEILSTKLATVVESKYTEKVDLVHFRLAFNSPNFDINALLNIINSDLKSNLSATQVSGTGDIFDIVGIVQDESALRNEDRSKRYADYLFELRDNLKQDEDPLNFDMTGIMVAMNSLNFVLSKKPPLNAIKTKAVINNFISYITNKKLISLGYGNKLFAHYYHG